MKDTHRIALKRLGFERDSKHEYELAIKGMPILYYLKEMEHNGV